MVVVFSFSIFVFGFVVVQLNDKDLFVGIFLFSGEKWQGGKLGRGLGCRG